MNRWPNPMHRCSRDIEAPYSSEHRSCTTAERFLNFLIPGPSSASFPLTPTLSLRERGRQRAALELSDGLRSADQRAAILTLPEGSSLPRTSATKHGQSQRDCVIQPRVSMNELPWENGPKSGSTPKGLHQCWQLAATPLGLAGPPEPQTQGSSCLATLGLVIESLRD